MYQDQIFYYISKENKMHFNVWNAKITILETRESKQCYNVSCLPHFCFPTYYWLPITLLENLETIFTWQLWIFLLLLHYLLLEFDLLQTASLLLTIRVLSSLEDLLWCAFFIFHTQMSETLHRSQYLLCLICDEYPEWNSLAVGE